MRSAFFVLILTMLSTFVAAQWQLYDRSPEMGITYYVDMSSITRSGSRANLQIILDYAEPQKWYPGREQDTYRSVRSVVEHDCSSSTTRMLESSMHRDQMGGGVVVKSVRGTGAWSNVLEGSAGQKKRWGLACGR
jgi:hypothetical protein